MPDRYIIEVRVPERGDRIMVTNGQSIICDWDERDGRPYIVSVASETEVSEALLELVKTVAQRAFHAGHVACEVGRPATEGWDRHWERYGSNYAELDLAETSL